MTRSEREVLVVGTAPSGSGRTGSPARPGWTVRRAESIEAALGALAPSVDCVVTRRTLPDGDAFALLEAVRERREAPVVLAPSDGSEAVASRAVAAGFDAYVPPAAGGDGEAERLEDAVERVTVRPRSDGSGARTGRETARTDGPRSVGTGRGPGQPVGPDRSGAAGVPDAPTGSDRADDPAAILEAVPDLVWTVDADGTVTYVNTDAERINGVHREEVLGRSLFDALADVEWTDPEADGSIEEVFREVLDGERESLKTQVSLARDGETATLDVHAAPIEADGEVVGAVGINRQVTEQKRREREITALHGTARALLEAETRHEITELVVGTAEEVLGLSGAVVYLYDPEDNELAPAAHTGDTDQLYGRLPTLSPGEGITGHAFLQDDTTVHEDVHDSERMLDEAAEIRGGLFVPLGDHGIFIAGDTASGAFDEESVERAELLAAAAEAALDRAERDRALREQGRTVREQNRQLERLNEINGRIRRVQRALVGADTREQVEAAVCERLVESDQFVAAWIGTPEDGELIARSSAGADGTYRDRVCLRCDEPDPDGEPAARAAATGRAVAVEDVAADPRSRSWRREALRRDFRSAAAFPLEYGGIDYGVLAIYADRAGAFEDLSGAVLAELSDTVADAIHAVEQRAALLSDRRVECEFEIGGVTGGLAGVAADAGTTATVTDLTPRGDGGCLAFATAPGEAAAALLAAADDRPTVRSATVLEEGDPALLRFVVETCGVWRAVSETAGRPESVTVHGDGSTTATVTLPAGADVAEYADRLSARFDSVALVARRQTPVAPDSGTTGPGLTDRQREVLEAAYHAGFFEWPRASTGEEVAEGLGISQPAFLKHIRACERKLVGSLLGAGTDGKPAD